MTMIKNLVLFLVSILFLQTLSAQEKYWEQYLGGSSSDVAKKIFYRPDGTIVVAGDIRSKDGLGIKNHSEDSDIFILKYSTQGVLFWQATLGGSKTEELSEVIETKDGGYALIGTSTSKDGNLMMNQGSKDIWIIKLNDIGEEEWSRSLGGKGNDRGLAVIETWGGGYLLGCESGSRNGDMNSKHHGGLDSWIVKLDPFGSVLWEKHFGGSKNERVHGLHQVSKERYIVVNTSNSSDGDVKRNMGRTDAWVLEIDDYGNIIWQTTFGGKDNDLISDSKMDRSGNIIMAGTTYSSSMQIPKQRGEGDAWLCKITRKGGLEWSRTFGGSRPDVANEVICTRDGGYVFAGSTRSSDGHIEINQGYYDGLIGKVGPEGDLVWIKNFGIEGKDFFNSVAPIYTGGFVAAGLISMPSEGAESIPKGLKGASDIWLCNIGDPMEEKPAAYITPPMLMGTVTDVETGKPLSSVISLTENASLDSLGKTGSDGETGSFAMLLPTQGLVSFNVLSKGYIFYGQNIKMDTLIDKANIEKNVALEPIKLGSSLVLRNIYFRTGRWNLLEASYPELERLVAFLNYNPTIRIQINGHTDNTGNKREKVALSLNRANAVKDYLIGKGIKAKRLKVKGYGMHRPVASNRSKAGRRKNRRVEFVVTTL